MGNGKKVPTIFDVAANSGVSISTISRVINTPEKVNLNTRQRVYDAIDKLGFVPQAEARARALRLKGRIGVITPFFTAPSFVQRLRGIAASLSKENYDLVVYTVDSNNRLQSYLSSLPLTGNLDGLVIMSLPVAEADVNRLVEHQLPTVLIEFPHSLLNSVEINDIEGGRMAAEYLLKKGHKRIAFLGDTDLPEYSIHPVNLRLKGFRQVLKAANIEIPKEFVRLAPYDQDQARMVAKELLDMPNPPTAFFAATDYQALGVLKAARQLGVKVPEQLAIIGFDDLDMADYEDLTTIRQHLDESGRIAIEILLSHIADHSRPVQHITLPLTVIERLTA
ncbi:MAG: LacI family transcriptional regulator [Chloroflexi bacterium HGW-Chloroflexi-4]|jgi:LacI family transcriptional regulator|nr:MAG: LacI family transcriptional regulator [Chloroflexi bacterium HGW-Chloroflexi-7]PKN99653.1 MAG: LacI family transcriptional regulator [Chloroflexi bacterium HGW-Chloroflexi-4]